MHTASLTLLWGSFFMQPIIETPIPKNPSYPPIPEAVSSFGAIASNGFAYLYGGHTGASHTYSTATASGQFHRLDLKNPKGWEVLPGGAGLQGMNLAADGGLIYLAGGMQPRNPPGAPADNFSIADASRYDPATRKWTPIPSLPEARSSHDLVVLDGKLYAIGGWWLKGKNQKPAWHNVTHVLDLKASELKWTSMHQPFQRRALCAGVVDGKIYVLGGMNDKGVVTNEVDIYDPKTERWTLGPAFPGDQQSGFSPATCTVNGKLYLATGDGRVYRLDTAAGTWTDVGGVPDPRIVGRIVPASDTRLLVLGGSTKTGNASAIGIVDLK